MQFVTLCHSGRCSNNPTSHQVFVEYKLLNMDPEETETPGTVKVVPDTKLHFNFRKTFYIERHSEDWRLLNDILSNGAEKKVSPSCFSTVRVRGWIWALSGMTDLTKSILPRA